MESNVTIVRVSRGIAAAVLRRPAVTLVVALAMGVLGGFVARSLRIDTQFSALLPKDASELLEVERLEAKAGGTSELVVALGGAEESRLAFARELVADLEGRPWIVRADVEFPADFLLDRRLWLLSKDKLAEVEEEIADEIRAAKLRANPLWVDLEGDDEEEADDRWKMLSEDSLAQRGGKRTLLRKRFESEDGSYLFVRVKPASNISNMGTGQKQLAGITAAVDALRPGSRGVTVRYAGGLVLNQEQQRRMTNDIRRAAILALGLVVLLLTVYVRRAAATIVLSVPLLVGLALTLGLTTLTIGQLNIVSGFLVSALIGLGIDFEIHLYLRYLERLSAGEERLSAMRHAIIEMFPACLTSALTTAAAFSAMAISDFRGFREYGIIASFGVLLALAASFTVLPPLALALSGRVRQRVGSKDDGVRSLSLGWARAMVAFGAIFFLLSVFLAREVRWHNDFQALRGISETVDFTEYVTEEMGGSLSPAGIFVDNVDEAHKVEQFLKELADRPNSPIKRYVSLATLVPRDFGEKTPLIEKIRTHVQDAKRADLSESDREKVDELDKMANLPPWTIADLPTQFSRQFLSLDGEGQFVAVWPAHELRDDKVVIWWGRQLDLIQEQLASRGIDIEIFDHNRLASRVLREMREDAPLVTGAAGAVVLLILLLDFRKLSTVALIASSLMAGLLWMAGVMVLFRVDINVFNQAVIPTIVGIGIDNAVHIQHRYLREGRGSIARVVATAGSAALLATTTTAIGFGTLVIARHKGVQTLGTLALIGLGCTFFSSTVLLPALLRLREGRGSR